jgi:hypothetical protein
MPTRKQDSDGRAFRQDAFASSPDFERGLLGNLVAARCQRLTDREEIALLWWLQRVSWREGGLIAMATDLAAKYRKQISAFRSSPGEMDGEMVAAAELDETDAGSLSEFLARAAVDPAAPSLRDNRAVINGGLIEFVGLWEALLATRQAEIDAARIAIVETDILARVFEALDFTRESRSFVLIEGREGLGKSESARNWCERHPGQAIYVSLQSGTDEMTLFRCIAQAVGTACAVMRKAGEIKANVEKALQPGQLTLVLDEAHFLWPQSARAERSAPKRVDWLRTALIDRHVPVALISTPQYFANQCDRFSRGGWNATQIGRRLAHTERLPEKLSFADMQAVIKLHFPQIPKAQASDIAILATGSLGFVGAIAHLRKRLDFLVSRKGARSEAAILDRLIAELATAAGIDLAALKAEAVKKPASVPVLQTPGSRVAMGMPRRGIAPAILSRTAREQAVLSVT